MRRIVINAVSAALAASFLFSVASCSKPKTGKEAKKISADAPWFENTTVKVDQGLDETKKLGLITDNMTLGVTGRAGTTGFKPEFIGEYLKESFDEIIFVEDGLALGALMMARCMNSLGNPIDPIGGSQKGICIMQQRIQLNNIK